VLESERRLRQGLLLSDILREFVSLCEQLPTGHLRKTIYERALRGEKPLAIAGALALNRNSVDQHLKRARDWILDRIQRKDVDRSVFRTLYGGAGTGPVFAAPPTGDEIRPNPSSTLNRGRSNACHPGWSLVEVVRFVIEEMGALCPSEERLAAYADNPLSPELIDVDYHIRLARCPICNAKTSEDEI